MQGLEKMRLGSLEGERRIRQQWVFYVRGEKNNDIHEEKLLLLEVAPVVDGHGPVENIQSHWTLVVQLLYVIGEGHGHGEGLPGHQHRVALTQDNMAASTQAALS